MFIKNVGNSIIYIPSLPLLNILLSDQLIIIESCRLLKQHCSIVTKVIIYSDATLKFKMTVCLSFRLSINLINRLKTLNIFIIHLEMYLSNGFVNLFYLSFSCSLNICSLTHFVCLSICLFFFLSPFCLCYSCILLIMLNFLTSLYVWCSCATHKVFIKGWESVLCEIRLIRSY